MFRSGESRFNHHPMMIAALLMGISLFGITGVPAAQTPTTQPTNDTQDLRVIVRDAATHKPIKGAKVTLNEFAPSKSAHRGKLKTASAIANQAGSCRLSSGYKGFCSIDVAADGYRRKHRSIKLPMANPVIVSLEHWDALTVKVKTDGIKSKEALRVEVIQLSNFDAVARKGVVKDGKATVTHVFNGPAYVYLIEGHDTVVDAKNIAIHGDSTCTLTAHIPVPVILKLTHKPAKVTVERRVVLLHAATRVPGGFARFKRKKTPLPDGGDDVTKERTNHVRLKVALGVYDIYIAAEVPWAPRSMAQKMLPPFRWYRAGTITVIPPVTKGEAQTFEFSLTKAELKNPGLSEVELLMPATPATAPNAK